MKAAILALFILLFSISVSSQNPSLKNYTRVDGLPSMQVYDIYQDVNGYLWFATDRGISRYNGYSFESFSILDGLTSNTIFKFYPQKNGEIWCSTINNKLFYFNPKDYHFRPYTFNKKLSKLAANGVVDDFMLMEDGSISLSFTINSGVITLNSSGELISDGIDGKIKSVLQRNMILEKIENNYFGIIEELNYNNKAHFKNSTVISSQIIQNGNHSKSIQFGAYSIFKSKERVFLKSGDTLIKIISSDYNPINVGQFDENHFWIGYNNGGMVVYNTQGEVINSFLEDKSITYFFRDHNGGMWFSTLSSGVFYIETPTVKEYQFGSIGHIFQLAKDNDNNIWVSTYDRELYFRTHKKFVKKRSSPSLIYPLSFNANYLQFDWCTNSSIIINDKFLQLRPMQYFDVTSEKLISRTTYCKLPGLIDLRVNTMINNNEFYYLGTNNGLYIYNTATKKLRRHKNSDLSLRVEDLVQIENKIFVATIGAGLICLNEGNIIQISKKEGLNSNFINKIYSEGDSVLWICTNSGVNLISLHDSNFKVLNHNILPNKNVTDVEIIMDTIWIGTSTGLYEMYKSSIKEKGFNQNYFQLLQVQINGKKLSKSDLADLSHYQNKLTVNYQAISFKEASQLFYRYKIDGLEEKWNYTKNTKFTYPSIPYGNFKIIIQVSEDGKAWVDKSINIPFSILPPFYSTNWFRWLVFFVICLLVYLFFKVRVLSYNRDVVRELIRLINRRLKKSNKYIVINEKGKDVRIYSNKIEYVKSSGNYCEIHTQEKTYITRMKIGGFLNIIPDRIEYLQIHRSYIIRIDQIKGKSVDTLTFRDVELKVSRSYLKDFKNIQL